MQLRIPGPTPCPPEVLQAMSKQMINHRGKEFSELIHDITAKLKQVFQTKADVLLLTASGTGGMEAAIVNTLSPGDTALSTSNGVFGDRVAEIAELYGAKVKRLNFEWGEPTDPNVIRQALKADGKIKAVLATHNETSTGVTNDIKTISAIAKEFDKLILVDAISSLSCINLPADDWQCDVVITASQKGWMVPPGLSMVSFSKRAWQAYAKAKMPRCYWDFTRAKNFLEKGQTPWTPAVSICYALAASLDSILAEGLGNVFARHARVAQTTRDGIKSLGFSLFPEEKYASNTVTAVKVAQNTSVDKLRQILRDEYDVVLAGGQRKLSGKIFRIGHLGWVSQGDIEVVLQALKRALPRASS